MCSFIDKESYKDCTLVSIILPAITLTQYSSTPTTTSLSSMRTPSMLSASLALTWAGQLATAAPSAFDLAKRVDAKFDQGDPDDGNGKGGPILGTWLHF